MVPDVSVYNGIEMTYKMKRQMVRDYRKILKHISGSRPNTFSKYGEKLREMERSRLRDLKPWIYAKNVLEAIAKKRGIILPVY